MSEEWGGRRECGGYYISVFSFSYASDKHAHTLSHLYPSKGNIWEVIEKYGSVRWT